MLDTIAELDAALRLHRAGHIAAAISRYEVVLEAVPDHPTAMRLLALALLASGAAGRAVHWLERAVAVQAGDGGLLRSLGDALAACGRLDEALAAYGRSLALLEDPQVIQAQALVLLRKGDAAAALALARQAMALNPDSAVARVTLGRAMRAAGDAEAAVAVLEAALAGGGLTGADAARAWLALGNAEADRDRATPAESAMRAAIGQDPSLMEAHASLSTLLTEAGRLTEAVDCAERAVALCPDAPAAHWALAWPLLLAGDFARGWPAFEWRKRHDAFARNYPPLAGQPWGGEPLAGRSLLVRAEQGLGDTIQFARFLPQLARQGEVVLACAPALVPLLGQLGVRAVVRGNAPDCAFWVDQMSLPLLLGTTVGTIPHAGGYLAATPERAAVWRARVPGEGFRVGLVWAGNPRHENDRRRSMSWAEMAPLATIPGVRPISLQVGSATPALADHAAGLVDMGETAALIDTLDAVVAVDTAVAHLAGAMGKPVLLLLPAAPDWRWMTGRADSPWYGSMRLIRQTRPGDWAGVIKQAGEVVRDWVAARRAAPVSAPT